MTADTGGLHLVKVPEVGCSAKETSFILSSYIHKQELGTGLYCTSAFSYTLPISSEIIQIQHVRLKDFLKILQVFNLIVDRINIKIIIHSEKRLF